MAAGKGGKKYSIVPDAITGMRKDKRIPIGMAARRITAFPEKYPYPVK
jgi:hypothetical protein